MAAMVHQVDVIRIEGNGRIVHIGKGQMDFVMRDAVIFLDDWLTAMGAPYNPVFVRPLRSQEADERLPGFGAVEILQAGYYMAATTRRNCMMASALGALSPSVRHVS